MEISIYWYDFGMMHLDVHESALDSIDTSPQCPTPEQKAFQMLRMWRDQGGSSSTYDELAEALTHACMGFLAEKYCRAGKNK